MTEPSLTTLIDIGDELQGDDKWRDFVDGGDGFFYGIPFNARRVVKYNPLDKSFIEMGPDLGDCEFKWMISGTLLWMERMDFSTAFRTMLAAS